MYRMMAGLLLPLWLFGAANADDAKQPEKLPPPRELPAETVVVPPELSPLTTFVRQNRYDVWQFYGVNRWGYFRPRVVYAPYGSYYLNNGRHFPFDESRPDEWLMHMAGTPYRLPPAYMPFVEN